MNLIFLDYDLSFENEKINDFFSSKSDCRIHSLKSGEQELLEVAEPTRGIVLTKLKSGWLEYHSHFAEKFPFITHWIFCVLETSGSALRATINKQFVSIASANDVYCELIFDDNSFSLLSQKLDSPIKTQKKCVVVSLNHELAISVANIFKQYLPNWNVEACVEPDHPNYTLCDCVLVVGNAVEEMIVECPIIQSIKMEFWLNTPFYTDSTDLEATIELLTKKLNAIGWNIADYSQIVSFSSIYHELVNQRIRNDEISSVSLLSDSEFVMWDTYGLPMTQTKLDEQAIISFLDAHTTFDKLATAFCRQRRIHK